MKTKWLLNKIACQLRSLFKTGFFHIFGASTINKMLSVILSFVLVRLLSKADYGVYAYAINLIGFFALLNGLGVISAILQICSELFQDEQKSADVYKYGYKAGVEFDLLLGMAILGTGLFIPLSISGSNTLVSIYCLYPLAMLLFGIKTIWLRVQLMNREYALATNLQTVLLVVFSLGGAFLFGAIGLAVGQVLSYFIVYCVLCAKFPFRNKSKQRLSKLERRDFWNISVVSTVNDGLSQALALTGTFFVGNLLANDFLVADYQVATMIPYGLLFIPSIVMTYVYPYFARNNKNKDWTIRNYSKLMAGSTLLSGLIVLICWVAAEPIISLLFGERYLGIVQIYRILLLGFFFSAVFKQPAGNLLVTQRKLLINTFIGAVTIIANVVFSIALIPQFGLFGAACTYAATMCLSGFLHTSAYLIVVKRMKAKDISSDES